jgi:hypothetical protein
LRPVHIFRGMARTFAAGALVAAVLWPWTWPAVVYVLVGAFVLDRAAASFARVD